ncbi:hypothetical protein [Komagataeibacter sp. NFXK3]
MATETPPFGEKAPENFYFIQELFLNRICGADPEKFLVNLFSKIFMEHQALHFAFSAATFCPAAFRSP